MNEYDIIIGLPICNDLESGIKAIESIVHSTRTNFKFVIVVGDSTDGTEEYCKLLPKLFNWVNFEIIFKHTRTPLDAYNIIFDKAIEEQKDLYLVQSDVIHFRLYKRDWLFEMKELSKNEDCGLVAPLGAIRQSGPSYIDGFTWIGGWACYIPLRTLNLIGGYDIKYPKGNYGVDIDYSYNVVQKGLKIYHIDYWVQHHMINSREHDNHPDNEKHKKECAKYFRKKWKVGEFNGK
ncbi:MAG: glycosyltransferase family A protein [Nanoarchaeota archaeon]